MAPSDDLPRSWVTRWLDQADQLLFGNQDGTTTGVEQSDTDHTDHSESSVQASVASFLVEVLGDRARWVGFLTLGMVPVVLTLALVGLTAEQLPLDFVVVHLLATVPPFVTPTATHYWEGVFAKFVDDMDEIVREQTDTDGADSEPNTTIADGGGRNEDQKSLPEVATKWKERFVTWWPATSLGWMALILLVIGTNIEYFERIGIGGIADPGFWVYVLYAGWWGFITGFGFIGAFVMIGSIHEISYMTFDIDPLQPDGLAGLSAVGYFAIRTIWLLFTGSFTFPYAFVLGTQGVFRPLVYVATGIYIILLTVSFLYPTLRVNTRAQDIRENELEARRDHIHDLRAEIKTLENKDDMGEDDRLKAVNKRLEIQRLQEEFNEYADLTLYPFSVGIVIQFISALLPAVVVVLDAVLSEIL